MVIVHTQNPTSPDEIVSTDITWMVDSDLSGQWMFESRADAERFVRGREGYTIWKSVLVITAAEAAEIAYAEAYDI